MVNDHTVNCFRYREITREFTNAQWTPCDCSKIVYENCLAVPLFRNPRRIAMAEPMRRRL
jgi:hypothetical protein